MIRKELQPENPRFSLSYTIDFKELTLDKELGRGGFGVVYKATYRHNDVAVKQLLSNEISSESAQEFETESRVMAQLRSPNIVQFYGYSLTPTRCIVMEFMSNGSLFNVLHSNKPLDWPLRLQIATDTAKGLAFLHHENILHRDIKSLNILLDKTYKAKLTDFGLSKIKAETKSKSSASKTTKESVGTIAWMAPELFSRKALFTPKSDIYSLGVTFWELASRKIPFGDAITPELIPTWIQKGEREEIPTDCPSAFGLLIQQCWQGESTKRPDSNTIITQLKKSLEILSPSSQPTMETPTPNSGISGPQYFENLTSESFPNPLVFSTQSKSSASSQNQSPFFQPISQTVPTSQIPSTTIEKMNFLATLSLANQGEARAQYMIGFYYRFGHYCVQNYTKTVEWNQKSAAQGNGGAECVLGIMYASGLGGLKKDTAKALTCYQNALEKLMLSPNDVFSQRILGWMYETGLGVVKDGKQAFIWYEKAANQGSLTAQYSLGRMYQSGIGVDKDLNKACEWFGKAAKEGNLFAQLYLGVMYRDGLDISKDIKKSIFWLEKAAKEGYAEAQFNLGYLYQYSAGADKDLNKAFVWYEKAADQGHANAQNCLGWMHENGWGTPANGQKAFVLYNNAAAQGLASGKCNLGRMYENGIGVSKDERKAFLLYEEASNEGEMYAQHLLGWMYQRGVGGVAKNEKQAFLLYEKSANQGNQWGQNALAYMYEHGLGTTKDEQQACKWYEKAANQGNEPAKNNLRELQKTRTIKKKK